MDEESQFIEFNPLTKKKKKKKNMDEESYYIKPFEKKKKSYYHEVNCNHAVEQHVPQNKSVNLSFCYAISKK